MEPKHHIDQGVKPMGSEYRINCQGDCIGLNRKDGPLTPALPYPCQLPQELVGQLGPIGAAVEAALTSTENETRRVKLLELREAAVAMYRRCGQ